MKESYSVILGAVESSGEEKLYVNYDDILNSVLFSAQAIGCRSTWLADHVKEMLGFV